MSTLADLRREILFNHHQLILNLEDRYAAYWDELRNQKREIMQELQKKLDQQLNQLDFIDNKTMFNTPKPSQISSIDVVSISSVNHNQHEVEDESLKFNPLTLNPCTPIVTQNQISHPLLLRPSLESDTSDNTINSSNSFNCNFPPPPTLNLQSSSLPPIKFQPLSFNRDEVKQNDCSSNINQAHIASKIKKKDVKFSKDRNMKKRQKKKYECNICHKLLSSQTTLRQHIGIHTGEGRFECHICGKTLANKRNLTVHIRIHTGERPFKCKYCGKLFKAKEEMNQHIKLHTGENLHKCVECGKKCITKSVLTMHMRMHTGEKPYKCTNCNRSFSTSGNRNSHMKRCKD